MKKELSSFNRLEEVWVCQKTTPENVTIGGVWPIRVFISKC